MKVALHSILRDGQQAAYEREHATVPDDLLAALQRAGIRDWTIWRSGEHLFHVVDTDNFDAAMSQLSDEPSNQRWQEHMTTFVDHFETPSDAESGLAIGHVWTLREQLTTTHAADPAKPSNTEG